MHTITTTILNTENGKKKVKHIQIPSEWKEASQEQVLAALPYALQKELDDYHRTKLLSIFIPGTLFKAWDDEDVQRALPLIDWVTVTDITCPVIPKFGHGKYFYKTIYHLPDEYLENITCQEWHFADEYYNDYIENGKEQDLDMLIATLCRPADTDKKAVAIRNDFRTPLLSRYDVEKRAKKFQKLDPRIKTYILLFFSSCKKWVYETYKPYIFQDNEGEEGSEDTGGGLPFGWYSIFQKVAESGVFGTLENILNRVKFHDFCAYLITKKAQYDQIKKEQEAAKRKNKRNYD